MVVPSNGVRAVLKIPLADLQADPAQPRQVFERDPLLQLADSMRQTGQQTPIAARHDAERGCWIIVSGERRFRAAKLLGWTHIDVLPVQKDMSEGQLLVEQLTENLARDDFRPVELSRSLLRLQRMESLANKQLAERLSMSEAKVSKLLSLLDLPADLQKWADDGVLSMEAAYQLTRLPDDRSRMELAQLLKDGLINKAELIERVKEKTGKPGAKKPKAVTIKLAQPGDCDELAAYLDLLAKRAKRAAKDKTSVSDFLKSLTDLAEGESAHVG